jgi:hypothetical protein
VVTTDSSQEAISAVFTRPHDKGHHHLVAHESSKLTAAELAYLSQVLELLAEVHAVHHFLLCTPLARSRTSPSGLRNKQDVNNYLARWLDEIEEFRLDVRGPVPAACAASGPGDPLRRRPPWLLRRPPQSSPWRPLRHQGPLLRQTAGQRSRRSLGLRCSSSQGASAGAPVPGTQLRRGGEAWSRDMTYPCFRNHL